MEEWKGLAGEALCGKGSKLRQLLLQGRVSRKQFERLTSEALPGRKSRE